MRRAAGGPPWEAGPEDHLAMLEAAAELVRRHGCSAGDALGAATLEWLRRNTPEKPAVTPDPAVAAIADSIEKLGQGA